MVLLSTPSPNKKFKILNFKLISTDDVYVHINEIKGKNELLEKKKNDLKKNEILLPAETKKEREKEIEDLITEIRTYQSKKFGVGGDLFKKRKELIQPIQRKIYKAIESLAEDNNYSFVLDKSKHSNILFADPKYDKSDDIIRKLKK